MKAIPARPGPVHLPAPGGSAFLGLYIHVPFCAVKCDYCAFCSAPPRAGELQAYLDRLVAEWREVARAAPQIRIHSIFVGGGNPTLLGRAHLERLRDELTATFDLSELQEWTFESNPETFTPELQSFLAQVPALRVSLGLQRLVDDELALLGRRATPDAGRKALELALQVTSRVGADLILGVPEAPSLVPGVLQLLETYPLEHISAYFLTAEAGTPLFERIQRRESGDPDDIGPEELFELADALQEQGFLHYEISNFARPGALCRHNLQYWHNGDYLGFGPAAVGTRHGIRTSQPASLAEWLSGAAPTREALTPELRREEFLMLRLRLLSTGLDLDEYEQRFGTASPDLHATLAEQERAGTLHRQGQRFTLTRAGLGVANRVISSLF
jgi:oxygen-independent coproporphyrinogen-3 oxidase